MTTHIYHFTETRVFLVLSHWIEVMDKTSPRICEVSPEPHNIWKAMKANIHTSIVTHASCGNKECAYIYVKLPFYHRLDHITKGKPPTSKDNFEIINRCYLFSQSVFETSITKWNRCFVEIEHVQCMGLNNKMSFSVIQNLYPAN